MIPNRLEVATIARRLGNCQLAVSRSSLRGEKIAEENEFRLVES